MTAPVSPATSGREIALTGVPRAGTTLCCRLLGQAVDTVALFEPMDVTALRADDRAAAMTQVAAFFAASRHSLLTRRRAPSKHRGGAVPDNVFTSGRGAAGPRDHRVEHGEIAIDKPLSDGFTLVVKHNAAFAALLPELAQRFETFAIVRNPLAVLASWHSVDLPVSHGRLPAGERLDPALARALATHDDVIARQLLILEWLFARYHRHLPAARVLRYEAIVAGHAQPLADACGVPVPSTDLTERNASRLYDRAAIATLHDRLLAAPGAWRHFYMPRDIEALAARMAGG